MPRLVHRNPKYRKHASGQAIVTIDGKDHYLGPWGTRASRNEYDRVIGEWLANGRRRTEPDAGITIIELLAAFWTHAEQHYGKRQPGQRSTELDNFREALRPLKRMYGTTPAADFGPLALKSVRNEMIEAGWCRNVVNRQIARIKHVFKWGLENQLLPAATYQGVQSVAGLQAGRSAAIESEPIKPVPDEYVEAVIPHVSRQIGAMIRLQRLTGARPDEICQMRTCDIDMSKSPWTYTPQHHKTQHKGIARTIFVGQRGQEIIKPFLRANLQEYLFSPAEAEAERLAAKHALRITPMNEGNRPGLRRTRKPRRRPGKRYDVDGYRRAIARACEIAFPLPTALAQREAESVDKWRSRLTTEQLTAVKKWRDDHHWHPHQLRHNAATEWRRDHGAEATLVLLGDKTTRMIDVYGEKNVAAARQIMAKIG